MNGSGQGWMLRMIGLAKSSLSIIDAHHKAPHIEFGPIASITGERGLAISAIQINLSSIGIDFLALGADLSQFGHIRPTMLDGEILKNGSTYFTAESDRNPKSSLGIKQSWTSLFIVAL